MNTKGFHMSSPQVKTFLELVQEWSFIKETTSTRTMIEEMQSLIVECRETLQMSMSDVLRRKPQIIGVWCPLTWAEVPAHWTKKEPWQKRLQWMNSDFDKIVKEVYAEEVKAKKAELKRSVSKPAEKPASKPTPSTFKPRKLKLVDFNFGDLSVDGQAVTDEDTFWTGEESEKHTREYIKRFKEQAQ